MDTKRFLGLRTDADESDVAAKADDANRRLREVLGLPVDAPAAVLETALRVVLDRKRALEDSALIRQISRQAQSDERTTRKFLAGGEIKGFALRRRLEEAARLYMPKPRG